MKTFISSLDGAVKKAAAQIKKIVERRSDAVIAVSADPDVLVLCDELAAMYGRGEISFSKARFFSLCEFEGNGLCRAELKKRLLDVTDAAEENCFFLSEDDIDGVESRIEALGGLDLAVLGIGADGRIGFNEPATPFGSRTHVQLLAPATRRELAPIFGGEDKVPEKGVTMGIKTITLAREIVLAAFGGERAEPVFKMLYGRDDSVVPAAFLQIPMNVAVYLDEEAAKKL